MVVYYDSVVYYKSRKRELKIRLMNESRCDERLKARVQEAICLTYTVLLAFYLQQSGEASSFFSFFFPSLKVAEGALPTMMT